MEAKWLLVMRGELIKGEDEGREREEEEETRGMGEERGSGSRLAQGLTTSLFRPAVYQLQTKGLKVYAPLNKFAAISRLPTPSILVSATLRPCFLLSLAWSHFRRRATGESKIP